jgi:hypothetical protein
MQNKRFGDISKGEHMKLEFKASYLRALGNARVYFYKLSLCVGIICTAFKVATI